MENTINQKLTTRTPLQLAALEKARLTKINKLKALGKGIPNATPQYKQELMREQVLIEEQKHQISKLLDIIEEQKLKIHKLESAQKERGQFFDDTMRMKLLGIRL